MQKTGKIIKEKRIRHTKFLLYAALFFCFSLYIISSPPQIMLLTLIFAALHEAGHLLCAKILGRRIKILDFSFSGLRPNVSVGSASSCLLIYLSGVWVNLIFAVSALFIFRVRQSDIIFDIFVINSLLFLYNVMPVPFSDGDGILRCTLSLVLHESTVNFICTALNVLFSFIFFLFFSFRFFMLGEGLFSFFCSAVFMLASLERISENKRE